MRRWLGVAIALVGAGCTSVAGLEDLTFDVDGAGGAGGGTAGAGGEGAQIGDLAFTDDELAGEFGEGDMDGVIWIADHLELVDEGVSGVFTSRVFDAEGAVSWRTIAHRAGAPYGLPLPDGGGADDPAYGSLGVSMDENILLLHFDGRGQLEHGAIIEDASGRNNHVIVSADLGGGLSYTEGTVGAALDANEGNYVYVLLGAGSDFDFGVGDFSWSYWFRTTHSCDRHNDHIGSEGEGTGDTHIWIGCVSDFTDPPCNTQPARVGGSFVSDHTGPGDDRTTVCGTAPVNDGSWHHVAVVKTGHAPGVITLYVDGAIDGTYPTNFVKPMSFPAGVRFSIAAFKLGVDPTYGQLDEVAIWRRSLTVAEVTAIYLRGAARLGLQARVCQDAACAAATAFRGPTDSGDRFETLAQLAEPAALVDFDDGQFLQYRAFFDTVRPQATPELFSVTATATATE